MPQAQLTAVCARSSADALAESALTQLSIKPDVGSGAPSIRVSRVQRAELSYHANDINHLLVIPSLAAQMLVTSHTISSAELHHAAGLLDPLFSEELFLCQETKGSLSARNKGFRSSRNHLLVRGSLANQSRVLRRLFESL